MSKKQPSKKSVDKLKAVGLLHEIFPWYTDFVQPITKAEQALLKKLNKRKA